MKRQNVIGAAKHQEVIPADPESNILQFTETLRELRKGLDPEMVRHREGWRDRNGNVRMVDYIEWHTVADILDETAPNWNHEIRDIRPIGDVITVTVAITIDGVTREGIGTGNAQTEMGIKKAEHDALKCAAVKFGIARELYKREFEGAVEEKVQQAAAVEMPSEAIAQTLGDMITSKQLSMIRGLGRERSVDVDAECRSLMDCGISQLNRRAASALISHLQTTGAPAEIEYRRAG